jgi:(2Fe-2S) ferredoxin
LFKSELKSRGLNPQVRANRAGCLDQCELGPTVVIYPQVIWYGNVQAADVPRIIDETIVGGKILDDLLIADELLNTKGGSISTKDPNESAESRAP